MQIDNIFFHHCFILINPNFFSSSSVPLFNLLSLFVLLGSANLLFILSYCFSLFSYLLSDNRSGRKTAGTHYFLNLIFCSLETVKHKVCQVLVIGCILFFCNLVPVHGMLDIQMTRLWLEAGTLTTYMTYLYENMQEQ